MHCKRLSNSNMATVFRAAKGLKWDEKKFTEALDFIKVAYGITELLEDQVKALRYFFQGKHLYFSSPTRFWKIIDLPSQTKPLLPNQVDKLKKVGINAVAI